MDEPPDRELWVLLADGWSPDPRLRWFVFGNAHGHRGRFHVCSEEGELHRTVDLADVAACSPKAEVWLAGFLAGQEAGPVEYFGSDELEEQASEADYERWRDWNRAFRRTGRAVPLEVMPPSDPALSTLGAPAPWCYVGERFRVWTEDVWVLADPQPQTSTPWFWPGSDCETLDEWHEMDRLGEVAVCERCHHVSAH